MKYIAVFIGGSLGAGLRYAFASLPNDGMFPVGTFIANLLGALLMGYCAAVTPPLFERYPLIKKGITTGFIGAFTTFSTFQYELVQLFNQTAWVPLFTYMLLSYFGGIVCCYIGYRIGGAQR
ncbi:camphor resistance protein CrcB [Staphylococcus microti]|uniref:Fluoride-specific ion channel FluC n=1 Tax=Staphylococcus microti TaxID=569857 RepID=A0A0D6XNY1_9STAP|nr:fluoride efflux transporter CrcB [Staphylococcus microti]KIX90135.1 camphor resistance protein CrcB [Staphylococcus microti]PNZ79910.1 fluoride efflux transporter CrcB [Staphylococcus microti]SUM57802.1 CrcB family protein [Staphylococcus microti]